MDDQPLPPTAQQPVPPAGGSRLPLIIAAAFIALIVVMAAVGTLAYKLHSSRSSGTQSVQTAKSDSTSSTPALFRGNQQKARDTKRQTDIDSLQTQLEAYFQNYGYYPSLKDMNGAGWRAANMRSLDEGALADPLSSCDPAKTGCLTASPKAGAYSYAVTDSSGASCEADDTKCAQYTLTATLETGGTFTKTNLD